MAQIRPEILAYLLNEYLIVEVTKLSPGMIFGDTDYELIVFRGQAVSAVLGCLRRDWTGAPPDPPKLRRFAWSEDEYRRRLQQFEDYALGIDAAPEPLTHWCERLP